MTVTKADIVETVYATVGFSKRDAADLVEITFDGVKDALERGEKLRVSGFGTFETRDKRSRPGRNPRSGQQIEISARRIAKFVPSASLKAELNDRGSNH